MINYFLNVADYNILGFLGKLRNPASGEEENSFWGDIDPSDLPF